MRFPHASSLASRVVVTAVLSLSAALAGCGADNPFDPDAPADLQQPAKVAGTVVDSAGPVGGATVAIGDKNATTGDDGAYVLEGIVPGVVTLTVEQPAHAAFARDLVLLAGDNRTVNVELVALGADSGHIKGVARKAAAVDDDVPDFSGIIVSIESAGVRTVTNSAGQYDIAIAPGTYDLTLSAQEHIAQIVPGVVVTGATPTVVDTVTLAANPGSVSGTVTLEPLVPGQETHGGVLVTVGASTAVTADDDTYQVTGLAAGPAVVKYTRDGYQQQLVPVVIESGRLIALDDVVLARATGTVTGTVDVAGSADDGGVTITLRGAAGSFAGTSAVDGSFSVPAVPTGTYAVDAARTGFLTASDVVDVVAGATVVLGAPLVLTAQSASVSLDDGAAFTNDPVVDVAIDVTGAGALPTHMRISEDPSFPTSGAGNGSGTVDAAFAASSSFTLDTSGVFGGAGAGDGVHTVFVELSDDDGVVSGTFAASIELDTSAPVLGSAPVLVNFDEPFASSVSVTVTFDVDGASQVAFAVDGVVDTESFVPFAQFFTVLLPSTECAAGDRDCASVCAVFKDDAGNTAGPVCDGITLDTTVPAAPLIVESDEVIPTLAEGDPSVPFTLHLVDAGASADRFFDHFEVLLDPGAPEFTTVTPGAAANGELPFDLVLVAKNTGDSTQDAQTNLIRVRAVDEAGNVSPESTLTVIVDSKAPDVPLLAGAPAATNSDTVSINFQGKSNTADQDATFDHYEVSTTLLPAPFDSFQRDGIVVELLPDVTNTITVVAVDAAGNRSAPSLPLVIKHDDVAPFAPAISPTEGEARATQVEIALVTPSLDQAADDAPAPRLPTPVNRYQLKDGLGAGFQDVGPGPGPFLATLRQNRDNEVCLRGVDDAGNVGIEECSVIHEVTKTTVAGNVDHPHGADIFGDVMVFGGFQGTISLRDLSGGADDVLLSGNGLNNELASGDNDFHLGGDGDHVFAVWATTATSSGNPVSAVVRLDFTAVDASGEPAITKGVFLGTAPSVDGNTIVYFNQGRVRSRNIVTVPADFTSGAPLDPNPADVGTDLSGAVTLCAGTEPRASAGVAVWCQEPNHTLKRKVLASANAPDTVAVNLDGVHQGALLGGTASIQQPVVSANMIAWSSADPVLGAGTFFVDITLNPAASVPVKAGALALDAIEDADGFGVTSVQRSVDGLTNDVAAFELALNPVVLGATNDPSPQGDTSIDGSRLFFKDTTTGETMQLVDLSSKRWVNGGGIALVFEPVTSTQATAWIEARDNRISLVARRVPFEHQDIVLVDSATEPLAFFGPAHADPTFAVGGARVAFLAIKAGKPVLKVKDLVTGTLTVITPAGGVDPGFVLALDPDGDDLVFVDANNALQRVTLPAGALPATLSSSTVALNGTGAITFVDIDNGMIVAQRGGDPDRENGSSGTGEVECAQGGITRAVPVGLARGPKVALLLTGQFLLGATDGNRAKACFLTCGATPVCSPFNAGTVGGDTHVAVSRSGFVAFLNDFTGLDQAVVFDAFSRRRTHLTTGDFERDALTVADERITWADASLGGFAVFESEGR